MPNLGILVLWTLTHEIEFLTLSIIFQLGHPEPPSCLQENWLLQWLEVIPESVLREVTGFEQVS